MAKLLAPLLSHAAHGTLGGVLTYSNRRTCKQARHQKKQADVITPERTTQRGYFQTASGWWSEMTPTEQAEFDGYDDKGV
jgi:hypothetical protein